jgi:hypothetical protein
MAIVVLVCGGRDFTDAVLLGSWLGGIHKQVGISLLVEGGQYGADVMAREFAKWENIPWKEYKAQWDKYGKAAGHIRNKQMLVEEKPDLVVAFKGKAGTANMMSQAKKAGVRVLDTTLVENMDMYLRELSAYIKDSGLPL